MKIARSRDWGTACSATDSCTPDAIDEYRQSAAPLSSCRTAGRRGHGARCRHQRLARRAQLARLSGMGALDHWLESGDHLRPGRGTADSPGPGLKSAGQRLDRAYGRPGRWKLRADHFRQGPHPRHRESASGRGASDQRIPAARSTPKSGTAAPARIRGERNWADLRPDRPLSAENRDRDLGHGRFPGRSLSRLVQNERRARYRRSRAPRCDRIAKMLARLPLEQRKKLSGVGPRRAEIVVAGAVVYAELLERCQLPGFRYSPLGLRDGLLAQMAAEYDRSTRSGKHIESERWDSIRAAVAHYRVDMDHALQVREFAMHLFKTLEIASPAAARICGMALRGGHALRGRRLCESQRETSPRLLHHGPLGNSGIHAGAKANYRGHGTIPGQIAARARRHVH